MVADMLLILALCMTASADYSVPVVEKAVWGVVPKQTMQGECTFHIGEFQREGDWHVNITLTKATQSITWYIMNVTSQHKRGKWYYGENIYEHGPQIINMQFQVQFKSKRPPKGMCVTNIPYPTTAPTSTLHSTTSLSSSTVDTSTQPFSSTTVISTTQQISIMTDASSTPDTTTTTDVTTTRQSSTDASSTQSSVTTMETSTTQTSTTTTRSTMGSTVEMTRLTENWVSNGNNFTKFNCRFPISNTLKEFNIYINLNGPSSGLSIWVGAIDYSDAKGRQYRIKNYNEEHPPALSFDFIVKYSSPNFQSGSCSLHTSGHTMATSPVTTLTTSSNPSSSLSTSSLSTISTTESSLSSTTTGQSSTTDGSNVQTTTTQDLNTKYDYSKVLGYSILFYEAQRSGVLPASNRIPYRNDSATNDGSDVGLDLTGGWYDAGDHVKFNFPMAASTTILAWGLSEWRDSYTVSGQLGHMLDSIKWPLDYFLKCWNASSQEYYAQVGNGGLDHSFWGRPEEMTMQRPSYKINKLSPGSDVAAETAAALAIGSLVFQHNDYANELLSAAETLYNFANNYRGKYSDAIPDARKYYESYNGYDDELCYAAAMLYKATGTPRYLNEAEAIFTPSLNKRPWAFSWDDKTVGCQVLLYEATGKPIYRDLVASFVQSYMTGNDVHHTPKGLAWRDQWGALRYSANSAFIALMAAKTGIADSPALVTSFRDYARKQLHYMFGENEINRSYVIGFGNHFPTQPHHRSSSCDDLPAICNDSNQYRDSPSPQILYGALVGGPDRNGQFIDKRSDYIQNEVACDYNAGFQSLVAGILDLELP
ncbi:endoglucanase A-like [Ylistrum balloti]|uniref:endoglucanase A-like n=1 Tax=Ylistrum balloti TaxID=509963 RepID=UPI0029058312|nr:endoglucanase A-like [Ylistrum balloti]